MRALPLLALLGKMLAAIGQIAIQAIGLLVCWKEVLDRRREGGWIE